MNRISILPWEGTKQNPSSPNLFSYDSDATSAERENTGINPDKIEEIISNIESGRINIQSIYPDWKLLGCAFADAYKENGRELFHRLSRIYSGYTPEECDKQYNSCLVSNMQELPLSNFLYYAGQVCRNGKTITEAQVEKGTNLPVIPSPGITHNFPDHIFPMLPEVLNKVIRVADTNDDRDILLLGSLATISACLPGIYGIYDNRKVFSNLFLFVTASAAAGKGRLILCKALVNPIHKKFREESEQDRQRYEEELAHANSTEGRRSGALRPAPPREKMLIIPANVSSSGIFQILSDSDGSGLIFETEGDTLYLAFKSDYANYSDGFRKAFHHETISFYRRTNKEYINISFPRLSAVLSGTPRQVNNLITDSENGLFSRFIYYGLDIQPTWRNVFDKQYVGGLDTYFETLGFEFYNFFKKLETHGREIQICLTSEQEDKFNQVFSNSLLKYFDIHGPEYIATVRRLGLIAFRICMILTALRIKDPAKCESPTYCSENDFQTVLGMIKTLVKHSEKIFSGLPLVAPPVKRKTLKERYLEALPQSFDREKYIEVARLLSIPDKSADGHIASFIKQNLVHRDQHNVYTKG